MTASNGRASTTPASDQPVLDYRTSPAWRLRFILLAALPSLLAHAFLPIDQFIHRCDDAYYYFKIALNFPALGFWTFDGVHPTTGVQPLWAALLTALAQLYAWMGGADADVFARLAVAFTALIHFFSCVLLFHLLARRVSTGTALAATGAMLFPLGFVWGRVRGMENSLFALLLIATVAYYDLSFSRRRTLGRSVVLGALLGLAGLARLNAFLLAPCLLLHLLLSAREETLGRRLRLVAAAGAVSSVLLLAYVGPMLALTGHALPVSGVAKAIQTTHFLADKQIDSRFSLKFVKEVVARSKSALRWFVTSRVIDGTWIAGGRALFHGDSAMPSQALLNSKIGGSRALPIKPAHLLFPFLLAALAFGPAAVGGLRDWLSFVSARLKRLLRFGYLVVFAVLDSIASFFMYPTQLTYAIVRWWSVCQETILIVVTATILVAGLQFIADRWLSPRGQVRLLVAMLAGLVAFHAFEFTATFWGGKVVRYDWRLSWNDESYRAAAWLADNVAEEAVVGSWNAGVLGYYAKQRVVNLDGLVNSYELLPYLSQGTIEEYIRQQGIEYLSDMESLVRKTVNDERLSLTPVYSHYSSLMRQEYRIYRVDVVE